MPPATLVLPGETSSVPSARRFVEQTLRRWGLDNLAWSAALLVSELATNACLHARTQLVVTLSRTLDGVRLEVQDGSSVVPRMRRYAEEATTGRGLRLIADLARRWGVDQVVGGKVVWAELAADDKAGRTPDDEQQDGPDVDELLAMFPDDTDEPKTIARSAA